MRIQAILILIFATFSLSPAAFGAKKQDNSASAIRHVIQISVDGLSAVRLREALDSSDEDRFPAFRRLIAEGASTFNARTDTHFTVTLPNHTCMMTGRPVWRMDNSETIAHHGWTGNDTPLRRQTLHNQDGTDHTYIPSVMDVVHDHGLSAGVFASKEKFILYEQSYNEQTGAADELGEDNGRDKIDVFVYDQTTVEPETAAPMVDSLIDTLREQRLNYSFVHLRDPDSAGHKYGWESTEWKASVEQVDGYLLRLFQAIEADEIMRGRTAIILTADHGGIRDDHGYEANPLNFTIPFFVWGPGVAPGADLYNLNPQSRQAPPAEGRKARPRYSDPVQPIRNGDGGNLALHLLGLPAIPGSTINARQDLRVAR